MLTGETLAVAIRRTQKAIVVLDHGRPTAKLEPHVALQLVESQLHWCGSGTKRRVSAIELRIPKPQAPSIYRGGWEECWRTVGASILQPSIEWLHSRRCGVEA